MLTNMEEIVEGVEIVGTLGESDHVILEFTIMQARVTVPSETNVLDH